MRIPKILKHKCENATVIATEFCVANAARIVVTVVPIFAPRVYGKICLIVIKPVPANGIMIDVVTELLCTIDVIKIPSKKPKRSFLNK